MSRSHLLRRSTVLAAVMLAACADAPTAPGAVDASSPLTPHGASLGGKDEAPSEKDLAKEQEKAAKEAAKAQEEAVRRLAKEEYERVKKEWEGYKKAVEKGNARAEGLRCEPSKGESRMKRIGAKGGSIEVGLHTIEIPAGALASDVEITASVQAGRFVELQFAPHGLQFRKPVEITFDYSHCIVAEAQALNVVYVGNGWRIFETMPSTDKRSMRRIAALTDHFSGYMVSTGRSAGDDEASGF
ncbi:MAG: hypothetical protein ACXWZS_02215 [Gemmatirosa sp.]